MDAKQETLGRIEELESIKRETQARMQFSKTVSQLNGYSNFEEWAKDKTEVKIPAISGLDSLISFCANTLIASGVQLTLSYFEEGETDLKVLDEEIANQNQFLSELVDPNIDMNAIE